MTRIYLVYTEKVINKKLNITEIGWISNVFTNLKKAEIYAKFRNTRLKNQIDKGELTNLKGYKYVVRWEFIDQNDYTEELKKERMESIPFERERRG